MDQIQNLLHFERGTLLSKLKQNNMKHGIQIIRHIYFFLIVFLLAQVNYAQEKSDSRKDEFATTAKKIRVKYEQNAFRLKPSKAGHMGMRLWRNYNNEKYKYLLLQGINYTASSLDKLIVNGLDTVSLNSYVERSNTKYKAKTKKKKLRKKTFTSFPMYRLMGTKILRHIARLDELGLQHKHHDSFMDLIHAYDYESVFTDSKMIKAWGAQLANQVYWLNNLNIADYRKAFQKAVAETYPDVEDDKLSTQQFENKIYTLTHIIIAASEYYRYQVNYKDYASIIDYFRLNVDTILKRCKEDVIIEVGLSLLLVDESFPEIEIIQTDINNKVDKSKNMVLSNYGNSKIAQGEHRNIIAILLLDWQGCSVTPTSKDLIELDYHLPTNLSFKNEKLIGANY